MCNNDTENVLTQQTKSSKIMNTALKIASPQNWRKRKKKKNAFTIADFMKEDKPYFKIGL